MTATA